MKLFGRTVEVEEVELERGADGSFGPCYFCAAPVTEGSDLAVLLVERLDPKGDPIKAVCHGACAERARRI